MFSGPLINPSELAVLKARSELQIIDCSNWVSPDQSDPLLGRCIPGALCYDLAAVKLASLDQQAPALYAKAFAAMGADPTCPTVFYDRAGFFSAPRGWYMARRAGFSHLAILDGGLPGWIKAGYDTAHDYRIATPLTSKALQPDNPVTAQTVLRATRSQTQVIDARSAGRFYGTQAEPRPGMRSGHIPGALNLPFGDLKTAQGQLLPLGSLRDIIHASGIDMSAPVITTCGSGVTASGLAFIFHLLGKDDVQVYSGSWSEWGALGSGLPIEI